MKPKNYFSARNKKLILKTTDIKPYWQSKKYFLTVPSLHTLFEVSDGKSSFYAVLILFLRPSVSNRRSYSYCTVVFSLLFCFSFLDEAISQRWLNFPEISRVALSRDYLITLYFFFINFIYVWK